MKLSEFTATFIQYIKDNYNFSDVEYENVPYKQKSGVPYISPHIVIQRSESVVSGSGSLTRYEGVFRFYIHSPVNKSVYTNYKIADEIIDLLERKRITPELTTRAARPYPANTVGEYYRYVVDIPFVLN